MMEILFKICCIIMVASSCLSLGMRIERARIITDIQTNDYTVVNNIIIVEKEIME